MNFHYPIWLNIEQVKELLRKGSLLGTPVAINFCDRVAAREILNASEETNEVNHKHVQNSD